MNCMSELICSPSSKVSCEVYRSYDKNEYSVLILINYRAYLQLGTNSTRFRKQRHLYNCLILPKQPCFITIWVDWKRFQHLHYQHVSGMICLIVPCSHIAEQLPLSFRGCARTPFVFLIGIYAYLAQINTLLSNADAL